ncbi:hypothetical protein KIPB_013099, partial [Kipferlia bialata]|eukprot:g13099.t1
MNMNRMPDYAPHTYEMPDYAPHTSCRLRLLKSQRIEDFLLLEKEFISAQREAQIDSNDTPKAEELINEL